MVIDIKDGDTPASSVLEEISRSDCDVVQEAVASAEGVLCMVSWWSSASNGGVRHRMGGYIRQNSRQSEDAVRSRAITVSQRPRRA